MSVFVTGVVDAVFVGLLLVGHTVQFARSKVRAHIAFASAAFFLLVAAATSAALFTSTLLEALRALFAVFILWTIASAIISFTLVGMVRAWVKSMDNVPAGHTRGPIKAALMGIKVALGVIHLLLILLVILYFFVVSNMSISLFVIPGVLMLIVGLILVGITVSQCFGAHYDGSPDMARKRREIIVLAVLSFFFFWPLFLGTIPAVSYIVTPVFFWIFLGIALYTLPKLREPPTVTAGGEPIQPVVGGGMATAASGGAVPVIMNDPNATSGLVQVGFDQHGNALFAQVPVMQQV